MPLQINRSLRLDSDQYLAQTQTKDLIVLHHTVGGTARSTFEWWQTGDPKRIATAYIIDRDGTIYEVFDHRHWAAHLGLKGLPKDHERRSIGIELASEGGLRMSNGKLYCFDKISPRTEFRDRFFDCGFVWRGYQYFDAYSDEQIASTCQLVNHLCETFGIARRTPAKHTDFDPALYTFRGIIGHHHVRGDKSDLHPGFDWSMLSQQCRLETV